MGKNAHVISKHGTASVTDSGHREVNLPKDKVYIHILILIFLLI